MTSLETIEHLKIEDLTTPELIYFFFSRNIEYDYFTVESDWKCKSLEEIIDDRVANCHEASYFFLTLLKRCQGVEMV